MKCIIMKKYLISVSIMISFTSMKFVKDTTSVETAWTEVLLIWVRTMLIFWKCPFMAVHFASSLSQPDKNDKWRMFKMLIFSSHLQHFSLPSSLSVKLLYLQEDFWWKLSEHTQYYFCPFGQEQHRSQISLKWQQCLKNSTWIIISCRLFHNFLLIWTTVDKVVLSLTVVETPVVIAEII